MIAFSSSSQFLLSDLQLRFRPQREWVQGRGLFLIAAHFLSGVGAGAWLFASLGGGWRGLLAGWCLVALGGIGHLVFLGRWTRFWRMLARPRSSWISRGLLAMTLFLLAGMAWLALLALGLNSSPGAQAAWWLSVLGAAWVLIYKGFVWASSKGIPLWNSPLLPPLYIAYGVRGGLAVLLLVVLGRAAGPLEAVETLKLWVGVSAALLVLVYLAVMRGTGLTAARSVQALTSGAVAPAFYTGVVLLGLVIPIGLGAYALLASPGVVLLTLMAAASLVGDFALIYSIARAGLYRPLMA